MGFVRQQMKSSVTNWLSPPSSPMQRLNKNKFLNRQIYRKIIDTNRRGLHDGSRSGGILERYFDASLRSTTARFFFFNCATCSTQQLKPARDRIRRPPLHQSPSSYHPKHRAWYTKFLVGILTRIGSRTRSRTS